LPASRTRQAGTIELTRVEDPAGRVGAYDPKQKSWQIAHDPQPADGRGGTIWPPMANALVPMVRVPIGLVNVPWARRLHGNGCPASRYSRT